MSGRRGCGCRGETVLAFKVGISGGRLPFLRCWTRLYTSFSSSSSSKVPPSSSLLASGSGERLLITSGVLASLVDVE